METLFDLPAHALLIHAPIVLLPIAALATVALAVKRSWRVRAGWWFVGGVFSIVVMVFSREAVGEAFDEALDGAVDVGAPRGPCEHDVRVDAAVVRERGDRWSDSIDARPTPEPFPIDREGDAGSVSVSVIRHSFAVAASVFALLATVWLIRTGHEGADLVWRQTTDTVFD